MFSTKPQTRIAFAASVALTAVLALVVALSFASSGEPADPARISGSDQPAPASLQGDGSVRMPRPGISGNIAAPPQMVDLDRDGVAEVAFGTTSGFFIIGKDGIEQHIGPLAPVSEFTVIADITNDATDDVVITVSDTLFPNIRAYDTATGEEIWSFRPAQTTFSDNLMWTSQQTLTFDLATVDLDGGGADTLVATSGYRLYALDASTGELRWQYEWRDNLWKAAGVADFSGDGDRDVLVGSQDGHLIGVDGKNGEEIWKTQVVRDYQAVDNSGKPWKDIPQGVWDIIVSPVGGRVIITSEDGFVRSIAVPSGDVKWEEQLITHIDAARSMYYENKNGKPTGPGDAQFFNLRARLVPDVTGDGKEDILLTSYLGAQRLEDPRQAALFLLDGSTGRQLWNRQVAGVALARQIGILEITGDRYVVIPGGEFVALTLTDGSFADSNALDSLELQAEPGRGTGYSLVALEPEGAVVLSDNGDILWREAGSRSRITRTPSNHFTQADLVGDPTPDLLVVSGTREQTNFGAEPRARLLYVVDGSSGLLSWEYEPPEKLVDSTGGLAGITVGPDLNNDGRPEILAYAQDPSELQRGDSETHGEASRVIVLSGADGTEILMAPPARDTYYGIWEDIYLGGGSLETIVRAEMVRSHTSDLERQWDEHGRDDLTNQFMSEAENQWNEFLHSSLDERAAELNATGVQDESQRAERQAQMDEDWEQLERGRSELLEASLAEERQILESLGVDPATIVSYDETRRESFALSLEAEKAPTYESWWSEFDEAARDLGQALGEYREELNNRRGSFEQQWLDEFTASLESRKQQWMDENLGDIDSEVAQQLDQWSRDFEEQKQWRRVDKRIVSLGPIRFPGTTGEYGLFVATGRGISVLDLSGEVIWTRTTDPNVYSTPTGETDVSEFGLEFGFDPNRPVRVIGDINNDGVDDLRFLDDRSMFIATSVISKGRVGYVAGERFLGPAGEDGEGGADEIDDLNGDGVNDVELYRWVENGPPKARILSGVDGSKLMDFDGFEPNSTAFRPSSDFNRDGEPDLIVFEQWVEGQEGPRVHILDGQSGEAIWVYDGYNEMNFRADGQINSKMIPVTPVGDLTGDGVDEVALVRHLTWSEGASVLVIDVTTGEVLNEIITESKDQSREDEEQWERWQPGLLAVPAGDMNGDGSDEIAVVNGFGEDRENKRYRLIMIDVANESILADFRTVGSELIALEEAGLIGLVGLSGEIYTLDAATDLTMTAPPPIVDSSGPITVSWSGAPEGSFNQVIVDSLEVARTNKSSVELNLAAGEHSILVRSIDPYGRGVRATTETMVTKSGSVFVLLYVFTIGAVILTLVLPGLRWWSRRSLRAGKS